VALNKVIVQQGRIEYKEKNPITASSGVVVFDDVHATLFNVINNPDKLRNNGICTVHFNSRFLNKIPISATLQFYLNSNNGKFIINGSMKTTDATILNPLSKPMALVEVNSGTIKSLDFNFICNDNRAKGIIRLLYDDLNIKILKQEAPGAEYKAKKVVSLLANISVINANPVKDKPARIVSVSHPRDPYKSMFNLIWKSIFEGVQKTVGIDGKIK